MLLSDFHPHHFKVELRGDVAVVEITAARFTDMDNVEMLGRELFLLVDRFGLRKIVLTLQGVELVSSAFLGKLISLHRRLHQGGGTLVLCELRDDVDRTVRTSRLVTYFHVEPTLEAALAAIAS